MMFASSSATYGADFPALERKSNLATQRHTKPFVQPTEVQPDEKLKPLTQSEEVLNWQTENSLAQNSLLTKINQKVDSLMTAMDQRLETLLEKLQKYYKETKAKIEVLEMEIQQLPVQNIHDEAFDQREKELQKLSHPIEELYEYTKSLQK